MKRRSHGIGNTIRILLLAFALTTALVAPTFAAPRFVEVNLTMEYSESRGTHAARTWRRTLATTCIFGTNEWWMTDEYIQRSEHRWLFDGLSVYQSARASRAADKQSHHKIWICNGSV